MSEIEIFRAGRHTAQTGQTVDIGEEDLRAAATSYDPAFSEAPVVVGHPATDSPAYGWVKSLTTKAGALVAHLAQVDPEFARLVRAGRYKKISAAFYSPQSPQNPRPGFWYLRHVGFLGATPPAVKGLAPVSFSSPAEGVMEFDLDERPWAAVTQMLRQAKGMFGRKEKIDQASSADESIALREAALAKAISELEKKKQMAGRERFVQSLVNKGKVAPRHSEFLVSFMEALPASAVVQFAESDNMVEKDLRLAFHEFLLGLPAIIDYTERSAAGAMEQDGHTALGQKIAGAALKTYNHKEI